jgi:hypothetical protein
MTHRLRSSSLVRPFGSILMLVLAPALLLFVGPGCGHRRAVLRPIYATPTTVAPATISPPCDSCGSASAASSGVVIGGATASGAPSAPLSGVRTVPAPGGEPALEPVTPGRGEAPVVVPPEARRIERRPAFGSARRASLRTGVEPFVNDPQDLFGPPKADRPWKYIVLHHSDHATGGYAQIDREHRKDRGWNGCGYHFVIGNGTESPDGQIEVAQRWSEQKAGAHCRDGKVPDINEYGIGICLIGDFDAAPPTARQIEAARALVVYLQDRYAIPSDRIGTHALLASNPTVCPGKHFPAEAILGTRSLVSR